MKFVLRALGVALTLVILNATPGRAADATDPRIGFVTEYLRELSAQEGIRDNAAKELDQASTPENQMTSCIHSSTAPSA
jgi:hypothetical protein